MKQRWRKTKNRKTWLCDFCGDFTSVEVDYKPENCCDGYMCGCYGKVMNPVMCKRCSDKYLFDLRLRTRKRSKRGLHKHKINIYLP